MVMIMIFNNITTILKTKLITKKDKNEMIRIK